jgi:hypothetical protein
LGTSSFEDVEMLAGCPRLQPFCEGEVGVTECGWLRQFYFKRKIEGHERGSKRVACGSCPKLIK